MNDTDELANAFDLASIKNHNLGINIRSINSSISDFSIEIHHMKETIEKLSNELSISTRRVNLLELKLEGKISLEEYKRIKSMYDSVDTDNHYLADQAVKSLMKTL